MGRSFGSLIASAAVCALLPVGSPQSISFNIDATTTSGPLRFPLLNCVGSGHASLALREDYRAALRMVQRDVGFAHIRGHGIMDDDMSTYIDGQANMYNVFSNFDNYLTNGLKPIVELSFMPAALANRTDETIMHYNGITSPPKDYSAWGTFIGQFTSLLVERYGVEEVSSWRFEVWNEPNGCGFWCGGQSGYFTLYNYTARAIKAVSPLLQVGGPATAQLLWVEDMINYATSNDVPIDFLSTHLYPSDPNLPLQRNVFEALVGNASKLAAAASLPLVLTEFSAGWSLGVADEPYAASFLVHAALAFQNTSDAGIANTDTLSYWTFSDVFEEAGFLSAPYTEAPYEKFGLVTVYGVPKPAYRAMQLIASLKGQQGLPVSVTSSQLAAKSATAAAQPEAPQWYGASQSQSVGASSGTVDILTGFDSTSNPPLKSISALLTNFNAILAGGTLPITDESVTIVWSGITTRSGALPTAASVTIIDSSHAFAKPTWKAYGSPIYPNATEIAAEMAASQATAVQVPLVAGPGAGQVSLTLQLEPYATAMVLVEYE